MSILSSKLLIAIVSLFVVTGYAWDILDYCCDEGSQAQAVHAKTHPGEKAPEQPKNDCKCICHQVFTGPEVQIVRLIPRVLTPTDYVGHTNEFPPDAVPLGIDYPPQLA